MKNRNSTTIIEYILEANIKETFGTKEDDLFIGLCHTLYIVLDTEINTINQIKIQEDRQEDRQKKNKTFPIPYSLMNRFVQFLWSTCLFPYTNSNGGCFALSTTSRQACYMLLSLLPFQCKQIVNVSNLNGFTTSNWYYDSVDFDRQDNNNGYVGLMNQGATCYMNSILQQLYHIPSFRNAILYNNDDEEEEEDDDDDDDEKEEKEHEANKEHDTDKKDRDNERNDNVYGKNNETKNATKPIALSSSSSSSLLHQLKTLFGYLLVSSHNYYDTLPFCQSITDGQNQPLNLSEQKDVNEFTSYLFELLEKSSTNVKNIIQNHFQGEFVHEIISQNKHAPYVSTRDEPFYMITVPVKNKDTVEEGLELLTTGESLIGENQYRLPKEISTKFQKELLGSTTGNIEKVDAQKIMTIKKLPKHLILHLKRFEFDYSTMNKIKINDKFTFPIHLNMYPFTHQGRKRTDEEKRLYKREQVEKRTEEDDDKKGGEGNGTLFNVLKQENSKHSKDSTRTSSVTYK